MIKHFIELESMAWENGGAGVRYKAFIKGSQRIRLVEFSEGFEEKDWCKNGHAGYVLDGAFLLDFSGRTERLKKGDAIIIDSGEEDNHKAILGKGEKVLILLFEII